MKQPEVFEINFDGIVGPTHNYAGLSTGNLASLKHARSISHPKAAALQGLAKMKFLHDLGVRQAVLPPHPRPDLSTLRTLGFHGNDAEILSAAHKQDQRLLAAVYSASAMWAANAATVSPSADCRDDRIHFTPANLITQLHRSIEPPVTAAILQAIFPDQQIFIHHDPLPSADAFADEGAANHMRLTAPGSNAGIEIFIYGRSATQSASSQFPARQTLEAAAAIARRHRLNPDCVVFLKQNPKAIDAGAFHNDVVAVSNENILLMHQEAFESPAALDEIRTKFRQATGAEPIVIAASAEELTLAEAVQTYIFNSQLVTLPDGSMSLIAPIECRDHPRVQQFLQRVLSTGSIKSIHYQDVRQSMNNGGGHACLRLRVALTEEQSKRVHPGVIMNEQLHANLKTWIEQNYRESLHPNDLADPALLQESTQALDQLTELLGLGSIYDFQK